jgi:hypothetical protein
MYLNAEQRIEAVAAGNNPDSHTFIAEYYGFKGADEDMLNAYEYNPLTGKFTVDRMPNKDDSEKAQEWVKSLDFKTVCPQMIIKTIVHPLEVKHGDITEQDIERLKKWASVWDSVWDSVRASVGASVWDSVRASVWDSVGASVWDSVRASVGASVWDSVWGSVGDSVRASVWAYMSSFFCINKWKYIDHAPGENPFQCCINLWESGLVPSFDGTTWRLHAGKNAKIVYEWRK